MPSLDEITAFCDLLTRKSEIKDFEGAFNGLQFANSGKVGKIGAAVDAGLVPFQEACRRNIDFLIVHHGMYWNGTRVITEHVYEKYKQLIDGDCAVYSSHLPLDCHQEIGNNAILADAMGLDISEWFLEYEGVPIAAIAQSNGSRAELADNLRSLFPNTFTAIEFGSDAPERVAILSGSGRSAIPHLKANNCDTLITGELRQEHFNLAQELNLNLYPCGHYETEVFGVKALAEAVSTKFGIEWEFINTSCPL